MCGIVGQISLDRRCLESLPLQSLQHRGPDAKGQWTNRRNCILGHTRLSVIDLNPRADQPMTDPSGRFTLVYNGEIYNYRELRQSYLPNEQLRTTSDTEILLLLWRDMGVKCLNFLRGMFAFAVWDDKENKLWLARDRFGQKPLVYNIQNRILTFASELNALAICITKLDIDPAAIDLFMGYQFIPAPYTIYKNTFKLRPAHYAVFDNGKIQIKQYWRLRFDENKNARITKTKAIELLEAKIRQSIKYRLNADVPVGILLSGGVDSSTITAIASQESSLQIQTFSVGFKEENYNELDYANYVAKRYNTDHNTFILSASDAKNYLHKSVIQYGEPYGDKASLPSLLVCEAASQKLKVVLNGDGGDELLAGYPKYNILPFQRLLGRKTYHCHQLAHQMSQLLCNIPQHSLMQTFFQKLLVLISPLQRTLCFNDFVRPYDRTILYLQEFAKSTGNARCEYERSLLNETSFDTHPINQLLSIDYRNYLSYDLLVKVDIASMAFGLEVRSPFLDHELMEFAATLPINFKIRGGTGKYLLKEIAIKYLPEKLLFRKKHGFNIPVANWMRTEFNSFIKDMVADTKHPLWNYFRKDTVAKWMKQHEQKYCNHGYRLWLILILGIWLQEHRHSNKSE